MLKRIALLALLFGAVGRAGAQETNPAPQVVGEEGQLPFEVRGNFDLGFRWRETGGNEFKYFEDVNLRTGPRLFNLNVDVTPIGSGFFDVLNLSADHLGGDPFESFAVTLKNYEKYDFRYTRNKSTYFYRDTLLPPGQASVSASSGGDFHTFDFDRTFDIFDFNFRPTRQTKVFIRFNRQSRIGDSTNTLDIARDEFEMDVPLEEIKNDYMVGFQLDLDRVSFYFDETFRDYENDRRLFLPGASVGEDPTNLTELFFFEQVFPYDFKMPQSTLRVNVRPDRRLTVNLALIYSTLDADLRLEEDVRGVDFTGAPLVRSVTGQGTIDRRVRIGDVHIAYSLTERLDVIGGARFDRFEQQAEFTEAGAGVDTGVDIATDLYEAGVRFWATADLTLSGGVRFESRDATLIHEDGPDEHPATDRATFFVNGTVSPYPWLNVLGEYERGNYDNPFTLISPTAQDRAKVRVRATPREGLSLVGSYLLRNIDNELSGGQVDSSVFTAFVGYDVSGLAVFGSYSRRDLTNEITNLIRTTGFQGGQTFTWTSFYEANVDMATGGLRYALFPQVTTGTEIRAFRNRGTFGLDWEQYRVFADFSSPAGYVLRVAFQRNDYSEVSLDFDDYDANIVEVSLGYRF